MTAPEPTPNPKTIDLVRRAQAGSRDALEDLLRRYQPLVLKVVRDRLGQRLRARMDSMDLTQRTLIKSVECLDRFQGGKLINWMAKIAEHQIKDAAEHEFAGKRSLDREEPLESGGETPTLCGEPIVDAATALDQLEHAEEWSILQDCLAELPEAHREVLVLRDFLGLPFARIVERTGRASEGAARMMYGKAKAELKEKVEARLRR